MESLLCQMTIHLNIAVYFAIKEINSRLNIEGFFPDERTAGYSPQINS